MSRELATIGAHATVAEAAALMVERRISGVPVVDGDRQVVGMLTEGDLLHREETGTGGHRRSRFMQFILGNGRAASDYVQSHTRKVSDLMATDVVSVTEDTSLADVVDLLEQHHIRRVPVLRDGVLVGVVSRHDLMRMIALSLRAVEVGGTDAEIERRLKRELEAQPWSVACNIAISVDRGTVRLDGMIYSEQVRHALVVAAENAAPPGAVVEDRLIWCEPNSGLVLAGP